MLEINSADDPADNVGPLSALSYGFSLVYCMTTSLARGGAGLGTCGMPETKVRELGAGAGFSEVTRAPPESPFNTSTRCTLISPRSRERLSISRSWIRLPDDPCEFFLQMRRFLATWKSEFAFSATRWATPLPFPLRPAPRAGAFPCPPGPRGVPSVGQALKLVTAEAGAHVLRGR